MFDVILPSEEVGAEPFSSTANSPTNVVTDFSLQRSRGTLDLAFSIRDGRSYPARAFQQGALKVRFPNVARGCVPEAVILNTAGGLAGDDRLDMRVQVDADTSATLTSQACEKIYRALGKPAQVTLKINLDAGARLEWLPQPMIFFDGACLERRSEIVMTSESSLLMVEGVVFGRAAMGEVVKSGSLSDLVTIRRDGRLIHADRFAASGDIARLFGRQAILDGHRAMATTRYVASDAERRLEEMRKLVEVSICPAAVSAWDGMLVMRHLAHDSYTLNKELIRALSVLRGAPMPRVWSI